MNYQKFETVELLFHHLPTPIDIWLMELFCL